MRKDLNEYLFEYPVSKDVFAQHGNAATQYFEIDGLGLHNFDDFLCIFLRWNLMYCSANILFIVYNNLE